MSGANLASGIGLPSPVSSSRPSTLIELRGITKAFPGVVANDCIDLTLRGGEIHCLLGENGAGKSTLIGILSGLIRPDAGRIAIDGVETAITSPRRALELGIGTVHQHSTLIPALTVLENLMLGDSRTLRLNERAARSRLADLSAQLSVEIDPDARVADLALGHQQQVEIVKALWRGSRLLILDEPTSMLTPQGVAELAKVLDRLKQSGQAVVFITHKLHEALTLGDQISILRQGRLVGEITPEEIRTQSQAELRANRTQNRQRRRRARAPQAHRPGCRLRARSRRHLVPVARGRDPRHRRDRRTRAARARGSDRRAAAPESRAGLALWRGGDGPSGFGSAEARPPVRHRRPTGRGDRRHAPCQPQPLPETHR